jgi:hypothetical protein
MRLLTNRLPPNAKAEYHDGELWYRLTDTRYVKAPAEHEGLRQVQSEQTLKSLSTQGVVPPTHR